MAQIAKPPCDEGMILAASSNPSSISFGPWVLAATILGSSMAFIDGTVVNVALPALQTALGATVSEVQWVVESYALFLAALLLPGGSLGDLYGRRKIFATGVVLFALASAWCGLAPNMQQLIAARALQGAGGALLVPGSLALISVSFPVEERGRAIGTWSGFTAITAAIGPVLGGWLVEHGSWRWVFFINLPIAVVVLALTLLRVPESRNPEQAQERVDWMGALLATIGLGGIVFALIEPSHAAVAAPVGVVALLCFFFVERRSRAPMLSFDLFRSRNFSGANLLTLFLYTALSGVLFFFPLNLIQIQGYPRYQSGRGTPTIHFASVRALTLVGWASPALWSEAAASNRSADRGNRLRPFCKARDWRELLEDVFPGGGGSWIGNGRERCATHDHGDGLRFSELRGSRFGNQ